MQQQVLTEHRFLRNVDQGVGPIGAVLKAGREIIVCCPVWQDLNGGGVSQDHSIVLHTHQSRRSVASDAFLSNKETTDEAAGSAATGP